jgi:hypothetical protein
MRPNSAQRCSVGTPFSGIQQALRVEGALDRMEQARSSSLPNWSHMELIFS